MAWSASKIFVATIEDILENTTAIDLNSDGFKIALYDNDITPDQTVTSANTAYNVSFSTITAGGFTSRFSGLVSATSICNVWWESDGTVAT